MPPLSETKPHRNVGRPIELAAPDFTRRERVFWLLALVTACVAFAARLGHEPLWLDETYSYAMAQHGLGDLLRLTAHDVHPPLYYSIAKASMAVFGASPISLRLPSVFASVGLVALGAGPVRQLWGRRAAALFAVLLVTSPGVLCFAQEGRMYALTTFLVTAAVVYGQLALFRTQTKDLFALGLFTWCAAMTHYFGLVAVAINGLLLLAQAARSSKGRSRPLLLALGAASVAYLPWVFPFLQQLGAVGRGFWIPPTSLTLLTFGLVAPFTYKFEDIAFPWQALVSLGLVTLLVVSTSWVAAWRNRLPRAGAQAQNLTVFFLTLGFGLWFSYFVQPIFMPRYMMACAGLLLLATAVALARLPGNGWAVAGTLLLVALNLPAWLRIQTETFNGPFELLAAEVAAVGEPTPVLLHNDVQGLYPSWSSVPKATHVAVLPEPSLADPTGDGLYDSARLMAADLDTALAKARRVWIVDTEPAGTHLQPSDVTRRPGWKQRGASLDLALPMSWVKLRVSRFERDEEGALEE